MVALAAPRQIGGERSSAPFTATFDRFTASVEIKLKDLPGNVIKLTGASQEFFSKLITSSARLNSPTLSSLFDGIVASATESNLRDKIKVSVPHTMLQDTPLTELLKDDSRWRFDGWQNRTQIKQNSCVLSKADFLNPETCSEIYKKLGTQVIFHSLDFRGVGDGNNYGLRREIDSFFASVREEFAKRFADKGVLVNWGGDELVVIFKSKTAATDYQEFSRIIGEVKKRTFSNRHKELNRVAESLRFREEFRRLSKYYFDGRIDINSSASEQAKVRMAGDYPNFANLNLDPAAQAILALAYSAVKDKPLDRDFFLSVSGARVRFDADKHGETPELALKAIAQGYRGQISTKGFGGLGEATDFDPNFKSRSSDADLLATAKKLLGERGERRRNLLTLGRLLQTDHLAYTILGQIALASNRCDTGLARIDGAPLTVLHAKKSENLSLHDIGLDGPVSVIKFDMSPFRQFNNTLGYEEADARFLAFARTIEENSKGCRLIRSGGSIYLLKQGVVDSDTVSQISDALSTNYANIVGGDQSKRVALQFELDKARLAFDAIVRGVPEQELQEIAARRYDEPFIESKGPRGDSSTKLSELIF